MMDACVLIVNCIYNQPRHTGRPATFGAPFPRPPGPCRRRSRAIVVLHGAVTLTEAAGADRIGGLWRRPDRRPIFRGALLVASLACLPRPVAAQAAERPAAPPSAVATRVSQPPVVDGDVLGDPAWAAVPPLTDFWQTTPFEGARASEPTEVRIAYTADTLYFGVVCRDSDPSSIVINGSRRDSPLDETDAFQIVLDTYRDRQNAFVFGTNPAGLEYDGQVTNEGQGGGARAAREPTAARSPGSTATGTGRGW